MARNIRSASPGSVAQPLGERLVVAVREQPPARLRGRLAGARPRDALVARDRDAQPGAGARECDALGRPQRQPQRIQLGPAADEQAPVELERDEVPGHRHRLDADVRDEPAGRRSGTAEDVRPEVHPVRPARLAADAAAQALGALEHDDVAVAQVPGRREARDAASDHDGVAHGLVLAAEGVGGQADESSVRAFSRLVVNVAPSGGLFARGNAAAAPHARAARARRARDAGRRLRDRRRRTIWYWLSYLRGPRDDSPFTRGPYLLRVSDERGGAALERARRQPGAGDGGRPRTERPSTSPAASCAACSPTRATPGSRASTARRRRAARSRRRRAALDRSVRFAVLADYGSGNDDEWAVGRLLAAQRPEFAVTAGDNSYLVAAEVLLDRNIFQPARRAHAQRADVCLPGRPRHVLARPGRDQPGVRPARGRPLHRRPRADPGRRPGRRAQRARGHRVRRAASCASRARRPLRRLPPAAAGRRSDPPGAARERRAAVFSGHLHRYERRTVEGVADVHGRHRRTGPGLAQHTKATPGADVSLLDIGALMVDVRAGRRRLHVPRPARPRARPRRDLSHAGLLVALLALALAGLIVAARAPGLAARRSLIMLLAFLLGSREARRRPDRAGPLRARRGRGALSSRSALALSALHDGRPPAHGSAARARARDAGGAASPRATARCLNSARTMARCPHRLISPPTPPACASRASSSPPRSAPPPSTASTRASTTTSASSSRAAPTVPAQPLRPALVGDARERPAHDRPRRRAPGGRGRARHDGLHDPPRRAPRAAGRRLRAAHAHAVRDRAAR